MKKTIPEVVSENISALIELRDENTVSLGKKARIDQKTVWNYMKKEGCNPTLKKLESLARALDVSPALLLVEGAFSNGAPPNGSALLVERLVRLPTAGQRQVSEFIELWEMPKN